MQMNGTAAAFHLRPVENHEMHFILDSNSRITNKISIVCSVYPCVCILFAGLCKLVFVLGFLYIYFSCSMCDEYYAFFIQCYKFNGNGCLLWCFFVMILLSTDFSRNVSECEMDGMDLVQIFD